MDVILMLNDSTILSGLIPLYFTYTSKSLPRRTLSRATIKFHSQVNSKLRNVHVQYEITDEECLFFEYVLRNDSNQSEITKFFCADEKQLL